MRASQSTHLPSTRGSDPAALSGNSSGHLDSRVFFYPVKPFRYPVKSTISELGPFQTSPMVIQVFLVVSVTEGCATEEVICGVLVLPTSYVYRGSQSC